MLSRSVLLGILIFAVSISSAQTSATDQTFQTVFGVAKTDQNVQLVVHYHLANEVRETCTWVMESQRVPASPLIITLKDAGIWRLRQAIALAKANGIVNEHSELSMAEDFLAQYDATTKSPGGMFTCN